MSESSAPPTVGYVMSRFPKISETFILREMTQLEADGLHLEVLPLIPNRDAHVVHDEAAAFRARMQPITVHSRESAVAWGRLVRSRPRLAARLIAQTVNGYRHRPSELARAVAVVASGALLAERVATLGLDRLHAHYATYPALAAWVARQICGVPFSVTVHAHDLFVTHCMLATKLRDAQTIVAISDFNRQYLIQRIDPGLAPAIEVIHCGIRVDSYPDHTRRVESTDGPLRITCVASLEEYKGQRYLIEAVRILTQRRIPVHVTLIGGGPERESLRALVSRHGLDDRITLAGARTQDEVREQLAVTDCYVQPSVVAATGQMEGIPVALMEALASRLPVVTTRISGIPELIRDDADRPDESTGRLVPPEDPLALADAITAVVQDRPEANRRAQNGYRLVSEQFELTATTRELRRVFGESSARS